MLFFYLSMIEDAEDKTKFEQLYHRYKRMMYGIALQMTNDPGEAEDAVHDSFVKILRHLSKIQDVADRQTAAFLAIVLRNTVLDMLQRKTERRCAR